MFNYIKTTCTSNSGLAMMHSD